MIFVTVGTHEQQFNRLIREVDMLKGRGAIDEDVVVQTGFSTYEPRHCGWSRLFAYEEMNAMVERAGIVITHGGPASFIMPLRLGRIPVVVPRQKKFGEHVNDHQLEFCRTVEERLGNIILVERTGELEEVIAGYETIVAERRMQFDIQPFSSNAIFNKKFCDLVDSM